MFTELVVLDSKKTIGKRNTLYCSTVVLKIGSLMPIVSL